MSVFLYCLHFTAYSISVLKYTEHKTEVGVPPGQFLCAALHSSTCLLFYPASQWEYAKPKRGEKTAWEERQSASELHPAHSKASSKATLVPLLLSELQPGLHTTRQKLITKVVIGTGTA